MDKICNSCGLTKELSEFNFKNKKKGIRNSTCRLCSKEYGKSHYLENKPYYKNKAQVHSQASVARSREFLLEYLTEHPCIDCGNSDVMVLEFDHVRGNKTLAVSQMMRYSIVEIQKEIDKCEIRCANCHRKKTVKQFGWYKLTPH